MKTITYFIACFLLISLSSCKKDKASEESKAKEVETGKKEYVADMNSKSGSKVEGTVEFKID